MLRHKPAQHQHTQTGPHGQALLRLHAGQPPYGTLYIGVLPDLIKRVWQHKESAVQSFTKHYDIKHLVWYEIHTGITAAITREKQLKRWNRDWKINLIQSIKPAWRDLYSDICQ